MESCIVFDGDSCVAGTKQIGVKLDEDNLKILDELPNSAVEMQVKDKVSVIH